jgi:hypothetical protein
MTMNASLEIAVESAEVLPQDDREQSTALRELSALELGLVGGGSVAIAFV